MFFFPITFSAHFACTIEVSNLNASQALREHYGPGGVVEQGMDLFLTTLTKLFDSLQLAYRGQLIPENL